MDFYYGPLEIDEPDGFAPLDLDDDEENADDYDDDYGYVNDPYEEEGEEYEEPGLGGFDDLMPFGSFDSGFGWEDGFL